MKDKFSGKSMLLIELAYEGHHLKYVAAIVDILHKYGVKIKLVLSAEALNSIEYEIHLKKYDKYFNLIIFKKAQYSGILTHLTLGIHICKMMIRERVDIVIFTCIDSLFVKVGLPLMIAKKLGWTFPPILGILITCPGIYSNLDFQLRKQIRQNLFFILIERNVYQSLLVLDEFACKYLQQRRSEIDINYLPHITFPRVKANLEDFREIAGIPPQARVIGIFGFFGPWKGLLQFVSAFVSLSKNPDEYLLIMGKQSSEIKQQLETLLSKCQNADRVKIINTFVSEKYLKAGLECVDVVALPYLNHVAPASFLFHAACYGKPILGTKGNWLGRIISVYNLGKTCEFKDSQNMAEALEWAFYGDHETVFPSLALFASRHMPAAFEKSIFIAIDKFLM